MDEIETVEARVREERYARDLRPAGSLSPRYGVTKMERLRALGRKPEDHLIPVANDELMQRRGKIEKRRKLVAENYIAGLGPKQIAEYIASLKDFEDVTEIIVREDLRVILARWKREQVDVIEPHILKIVQRCERMINAQWQKAVNGDPAAQEQVRKSQNQIMRVLRIGAPPEKDASGQNGESTLVPVGPNGQTVNIQQINMLLLKDPRELKDTELALIAQLGQQKTGDIVDGTKQLEPGDSYNQVGNQPGILFRRSGVVDYGEGENDGGDNQLFRDAGGQSISDDAAGAASSTTTDE